MGENPCTLKNGDPKAPLPPKPTPTIPSSETMSLLSLFSEERCIASREIEYVVNANRALIVGVVSVSNVNVIIAIIARANHRRRSHHGSAARHRTHIHHHVGVGHGHMIHQEGLRHWIDQICGDDVIDVVVLKPITNELRITRTYRLGWIERRIRIRAKGIVDIDSTLREVSVDFRQRRYGVDHGVSHGMAEAFIVHKEESLVVRYWSPEGCAEIILYQMVVAHGIERCGIKRPIDQTLLCRAVALVGAGASHDIDLPSTRPAHFRGIASGLYFEFLYRIWGWAQIECIERRIRVRGAIEEIIVCVWAVAADTYRRALPRPPIQRIHVARLRTMRLMRARNSKYQVDQHAPVERQFLNRNWFHHLTHRSIVGVQHWSLVSHL